MEIKDKVSAIGALLAIICIIVLLWHSSGVSKDLKEYKNILTVQNDTIRHLRNKNGEHVVQIKTFELDKHKTLLDLESKDSLIQKLQSTISQYKKENVRYAAIIDSYSEIDTTARVEYIVTEVPTQPIYKWNIEDEWYEVSGITSHKETQLKFKLYDSKSVVAYEKKGNIITEITDHNPYSVTHGVRSYINKAPRKKKLGLGLSTGWNPFNGYYIGVGLNYNIIEIW